MRIFAKMFSLKKKIIYAPNVELDSIAGLPLIFFEGKIHIIDSVGHDFDKAVRYLSHRKAIGFDTETRPVFTPHAQQNGVALLQLSSGRHAFLFRTNKTGLDESLAALLANPKVLKIGASVHDDIRGLQKLYPFQPAGFVDLQRICGEWGIKDKSVKKLCAIIMGRRISKTQQLSNWEAPKLSDAQKIYAATDAWICREMYFKLLDSPKVKTEPETRPEAGTSGDASAAGGAASGGAAAGGVASGGSAAGGAAAGGAAAGSSAGTAALGTKAAANSTETSAAASNGAAGASSPESEGTPAEKKASRKRRNYRRGSRAKNKSENKGSSGKADNSPKE